MIRNAWKIISSNSTSDHNVIPVTCYIKCKRKLDWIIGKFKAQYCVRGYFHKILYSGHLNLYSPVVQWATVRLMLIFQWIIVLQSQIIDFINDFSQAYIPSGEPAFIELPSDFNSYGEQYDVVIRLKKILYYQDEAARIWYENLQNGFLDRGFLVRNLDPCLLMYKTFICVVYVYDYLFWECSQSEIDKVMKYFKVFGPSCMISLALISRHWMMVDFSSIKLHLPTHSWKPQVWSIAVGCQHPPRLRHLLGQIRMILRLIDIKPTHMLLL